MKEMCIMFDFNKDCKHIVQSTVYYIGNGSGKGIAKTKCDECEKNFFLTNMGKFYEKLEWIHDSKFYKR